MNVFTFDPNMTGDLPFPTGLKWRSAKEPCFGLYGTDAGEEAGYCRLTAAERDLIRPLNDGEAWFGEHSSGISVRFETDSAAISVRVKLRDKFNMTNMTQIGQCGMDLYVYDGRAGDFLLHEVARYEFDATEYEVPLSHFLHAPRTPRKYILHLPLYMAVGSLEIGLDSDAFVRPFGYENSVRVGIYGTSIVHGCAASRPGLAPAAVLSRALHAEVLNFGFSGVAFMEREMGEILGKRRLGYLIVDAEPNAGVDERLRDNAAPFLDAFFASSPDAKVVLYSRVPFALDYYDDYRARMAAYYRTFLRRLAAQYRRAGRAVSFADGSKLFRGNIGEYSTDGIHPNDIGMRALALSYEREIRRFQGEWR